MTTQPTRLEVRANMQLTDEQIIDMWNRAMGSVFTLESRALAFARALLSASKPAALTVWYGSMPESNGKTNWTAILHKGDVSRGITLEMSEYPDRVRYEADRMRWMIGELDKEPWILDYDADKHSGYTPPAAPAQSAEPALTLLKKLKRDLMHARRFGDDTLAAYRRACSEAEGEIESFLVAPQPSPTAVEKEMSLPEAGLALAKALEDELDRQCPTAVVLDERAAQPVAIVDENDEGKWADILPNVDVKVGQKLYAAPQPSPTAVVLDERAAFETWAKDKGYGKTIRGFDRNGHWYHDRQLDDLWRTWQARAAVSPSVEQTRALPLNFENRLTPYGMLVRALRIVADTTLYDMAKHLSFTPATLSSVEFGRKPLTDAMVADTAAYFSGLGIPDTLHALKTAARLAGGGTRSQ